MKRRHTPKEENLLKKRLNLDLEIRRRSNEWRNPMDPPIPSWNERKGRPDFVSRKRHPLDCGNTRCGLCSSEKRCGHRATRQERLSKMKFDESR